jgi:hypothetical protein
MAGNLPVPRGVEVKITWSAGGTAQALNILHFDNTTSATMTQAVANTIGTAVRNAMGTSALAGQLHTSITLSKVEVRSMTANSDPWYVSTGAAVPGTGTGKPLPAANALVVTLNTLFRGRSYKGRVYLWGFAELANDTAGGATAAAQAAAIKFIDDIKTSVGGGTPALNLAVLSRWSTPPGGTTSIERNPPILSLVASQSADARWDVQRRRAVPGI